MKARKRKSMNDILREAAVADGRSIFALARDSGVPYPVVYRFIKGDKTGRKHGLTLMSADKLIDILRLELRPMKKR